jgi:two-component system, OmpR family, osmolarity sensor histidine kinase EnvZ
MVRNALAHATPEQVAQELDRPPRQRNRGLLVPRAAGAARQRPAPDDRTIDDERTDALSPNDSLTPRTRPNAPAVRAFGRIRLIAELPPNASGTIPDDLAMPQVVTSLRDEYGADALRFTDEPEPAVWVRMGQDNGWLMLPLSRYSSPPIPWSILFATLAAVSLMGGIVGLYVFRLALPLRALADAAARFKVGQHPALPLTGPDEIRAVTSQFNAMADRLEHDDAERRMMLAGLPHDLRAPLSRAKLRLELMVDGPDSPKAGLQRDLAEVGRIAEQFVAYLRGLDHDVSGFRSVALQEIVRDRGLVWRESGHDVTIERADPCTRAADADGLKRAIDNLIANAFAHGGPPVTITGIADAGDDSYHVVIGDHGPGIPAAQREEALRPFTRLDAARGASGHCGLGLAVAQSIAKIHGGHVALADAPGGGLWASIVMPQRTAAPAT